MAKVSFKDIEHVLPDNMMWLEDRTILLTKAGSVIYGTNVETSDTDYKGVCIPPKEYYLGLKSINEYNKSGGKNFGEHNTKDDIDIVICHINKFVRDAMQGVPNNLDILFCRDEDIIYVDEFGKELRSIRKEFLSKEIYKKFCGFAMAQRYKLDIKKQNGTGRQDLVEKFGYDTKFAYHAIRLLYCAKQILLTHDYCSYRPEEERKLLLDIRAGKYTLEGIFEMFDRLDKEIHQHYDESTLQKTPNYHKINKWLIGINERALNHDFSK